MTKPTIGIKICGLNNIETLRVACDAGADFVGFVFYPPSPRAVTPAQAANLTAHVPETVKTVGLFVNPTDEEIATTLLTARTDIIQLHGDEPPNRVATLRAHSGKPVIKALRIATRADLSTAALYAPVADYLLFDARVEGSPLPGGNAQSFDWSILTGFTCPTPWFLAGGLTPQNVAEAIKQTGTRLVDVSSGVEIRAGIKCPEKIRDFITAARG